MPSNKLICHETNKMNKNKAGNKMMNNPTGNDLTTMHHKGNFEQ
jgi:hypothetical protein